MSGYKLELSENEEVGIIYKDIYYLNKCFIDIEDEYNIIRTANTKGGNFIIHSTYLPPNNERTFILELIDRLKSSRRKYNNLTSTLFKNLNMSREEVKDKLFIEIELLGFKVWYKNKKEEYTKNKV